ncbi:MAG TPA: hypothetical protein DCY79_10760 [Planctomycetaceae bacterium]|nr:hypothetical protein [Planctomycetaceae bacterium]
MAGIMRCFAILFAALTLVVAGCRQDPYMEAYIDTLNLEKLALEDRLYELEYDYDKLLEKLKQVESDGSSPTRSPSGNSRPTPAEPPVRQPSQNTSPDKDASGAPEIEFDNDSGTAPQVEFNEDAPNPRDFAPPTNSAEDAPKPPFELPSGAPEPLPPTAPNRSSSANHLRQNRRTRQLSSIQIDHRYTGAARQTDADSDQVLRVVIQPRDDHRRFLPATGKLAIVAFDVDTKKRVGRWDLDPDQVSQRLSKSSPLGIDFRTAWPTSAAKSKRLHLFARLTTSDGRELTSDREINLQASASPQDTWVARSDNRQLNVSRQATRQVSAEQPINANSQRIPSENMPIREQFLDETNRIDATARSRDSAPTPPATRSLPRRKLVKPEWKPYR